MDLLFFFIIKCDWVKFLKEIIDYFGEFVIFWKLIKFIVFFKFCREVMVYYFCGMEGVFMSKVKWNKKEEVMYEKKMKVYKRKLVRFKEN